MREGLLKQNAEFFRTVLQLIDISIIIFSAIVAYYFRFDAFLMPSYFWLLVMMTVISAVFCFRVGGIYRIWRNSSIYDEVKVIAIVWASIAILITVVMYLTKTGYWYSRLWFGLWILGTLVLLILSRFVLRRTLKWLRSRGYNQRNVIIVGAGELGQRVAKKIKSERWAGLNPIGYIDDTVATGREIDGIKVLGTLSELEKFLLDKYEDVNAHDQDIDHIDQVWVTLSLKQIDQIDYIIRVLEERAVEVRFVPDIVAFNMFNYSLDEFAGVPVVNVTASPLTNAKLLIKEIEDKVLAGLILLLISPLLLTISIGVKLSSPGPVLYRQTRVSWNGKPFEMLKFRSMPINAESQSGPVWAKSDEDRATRFGKFLRKTSLDELPQFINVIKGEMSVVGPRPERPHFVSQFRSQVPGYMKKHLMKAGITGLAQINGWRGNTSIERRIESDLYYIENWSLWLDIKIIFMTLFKGFRNENAY